MFVEHLSRQYPLTREAYNLLSGAGIGSHEEMYALLAQFPAVAKGSGISLPELSAIAATGVSARVATTILSAVRSPVHFAKGAFSPPRSAIGNGFEAGPAAPSPALASLPASAIVHVLGTPVRDQGARSTCAAHAVTACAEVHFSHGDLSEQFHYWAAKKHGDDPFPDEEGTWLRCTKYAMTALGMCDEALWPYDPRVLPNIETQEITGTSPSAAATGDGATRMLNPSTYADTSRIRTGNAQTLAQHLGNGPVAVALPVFFDVITGVDNWSWSGALNHGHVVDPPQFAVVDGGQAVCINEFHPDPTALGGGWFVFKNSWGTAWNNGSGTPAVGHPACNAGYGYLSAAYVEKYLWELLQI